MAELLNTNHIFPYIQQQRCRSHQWSPHTQTTHTQTHTHMHACRHRITNMGFLLTSTTQHDSTVLYHITHDTVNLYEQEELSVHSDNNCYN
jgi:hypothetical protein